MPAGEAAATTAGDLPARWVIHTVGPLYNPALDQSSVLRSCYANSIAVAAELGAATVAFPLISSGAFGWPIEDAVRQALAVLRSSTAAVEEARLVLFDASTLATASAVFGTP
jgi:O-acetyl-ADP-ribose deacetylase (regulator of RNase III)